MYSDKKTLDTILYDKEIHKRINKIKKDARKFNKNMEIYIEEIEYLSKNKGIKDNNFYKIRQKRRFIK